MNPRERSRLRMLALIAALGIAFLALGAFATGMLSTWDRSVPPLTPASRP